MEHVFFTDLTSNGEHSFGMLGEKKKKGTMWKRIGSHMHVHKKDRTASKDTLSKDNSAESYWTCFMDGPQRAIVFSMTDDIKSRVFGTQAVECPQLDISLALRTVMLSLVNDDMGQEVATIGVTQ